MAYTKQTLKVKQQVHSSNTGKDTEATNTHGYFQKERETSLRQRYGHKYYREDN